MYAKNSIRFATVFFLVVFPFVTFAGTPTVSTLSPADDAANVALSTTKLIATFSEAVQGDAGNFQLFSATEGRLETIGAQSSKVTGSGTTALTITFSTTLKSGTTYYVKIDTNAVLSGDGNNYAGITDTTTWNFKAAGGGRKARMAAKRAAYQAGLDAQESGDAKASAPAAPADQPRAFTPMSSGYIRDAANMQRKPAKTNRKIASQLNRAAPKSSMKAAAGGKDHRYDRICSRVLKRFAGNAKMMARVNPRIQKRFGFVCEE